MADLAAAYGVFISYCGDVRRDFAVMLRAELERVGVHCFLDVSSLMPGDNVDERLLFAMQTASIGIVILSPRFFEGEWCMMELHTFMTRGNAVPVFFASLEDLKEARNKAVADRIWERFGRRFGEITEEQYLGAVDGVLRTTGLRLEALDGWWDECVEKIVPVVLRKLDSSARLSNHEQLIGCHEHLSNLKRLLGVPSAGVSKGAEATSKETLLVEITGMGGVGKTALAKKLYDEGDVRKWFGGNVCFVFVGGKSTCSRQEQILRELCDVDVSIENPMAGRAAIKEKLHRRKVFLCLDDVTNATEVVRVEDLGPGSRVVTTSRSKEAISSLEYKVELLDSDASWKLFCWHAFGGKNPPEDLALLCSEVMNLCKGLPLAIKVLARQLMAAEDHHKRRLLEEILRPRVEETRQEASDLLWGGYKALEPAALQDSLVLLAGMWPNSREFRECESVVRSLAAAVYGEEPDARLRLEAARRALKSLVDRGLIQLGGQKDSPWVTVHDLVQEVALRAIKESMRFCRIEKVASALPPQQLGELGAEHVVLELGPSERLSESFFATVSSTKSYVLFGGPGGHVQLPKLLKPGLIGCRLLSIGGLQGSAFGVLDLLTPIVGHELGEQFAPGGADRGWKAGRTDDLIKALESKGILFHDLLDLLPAIRKLSEEGFRAPADELKQYVLYLLRSFGLAYPSRDDSFDYVPMRCQDQTPADLFGVGFPRAPMAAEPPSAQLFGKRVHFEFGVPEGFAENVVVSLQTQLVHHFGGEGLPCIVQQWEHGTLFQACVRPGGAADNHNGARIRILLRVPQEGGARDVFELLWMLSEPGEAGSPTFVASEELAAHVNRWLSHFLEEKVVGLVSEVFCPYLVPLYEELVGCKGQVLDSEPATNGELGGHSAAGSLEEMSLEGMYTWQRDQRLSARARQLSTGKGGPASLSDREPTVKDDSLGFEESRSSQIAQEWELVPDDLLTMKQGQLNVSFTRLGARQAVYFSHFFSNRLVELNVSNASLGGMHVDLTPNRQLKILNAGFNNICVIQKGNWTLPESLESLFLYRNGLSSVPAHVSSLPSIANFNGDGNELVSFPDLNESVRTLSLSHNRFSSLPQKRLRHFGKLSVLDLKGNSLSKLPSEIGLLVALEQLLLSQNHLEELPSEIGDLPWLRVLDVAYNRLQTLPETVGRLTQLEELFVGYQGVSLRAKGQNGHPGEKAGVSWGLVGGTVAFALPETLVGDGLKSLRVLASQRNKMGPSLPVWVCKLRTLVELDVEDNNLEFLPDNDSFLSGLVASGSWSWRSAYMVGGGQKSRLALPALEILCLSRNRLRSFPGWIGESRQCRVIEANGNMLERIPVEFHRLHRLEVLELGGNQELGFVKAVQEGPHAVRRACHLRLVRARAFSLSASFLMALLALVFASSLPRALGQGEASCAAPRARGHSAHPVPLDLLSVGLLFVLVLLVRLWEAVGWVALGVAPTSSGAARNAASNHPPELRDEEEEWLFQTQSGSAFPANDPELQSPPSEGRAVSLAPIQSLSVKLSISASELALEENGAAELAAFEFDGEDERSAAKNDVGSNGGGMHKQGKDADPLTRTSAGGGDGTPFALDEGARGEETDLLLAVERAQAARRLSAPAQRGGDAVNMQSPSEPQDPDMGHPNGCAQAFAIRQEEDGLRFAAPKRLAILEGGGCCTLTASGREVSKRLARSGEAPAQSGATKPENRAQSDDASGCTNRRASLQQLHDGVRRAPQRPPCGLPPPSPAPSPNPAASPSQDPGKTVGPRYVRTFEWPVTPDQKPVCPKLHKDVAKQGRVVDRVLQKPTRGGAVTVYSTCTINHPADFKEMGQPLKVVTVTLKVYSQHHRLPELLGEDKEKDHGFYQEKMRVNLRPKDPRGYKKQPAVPNTDDFQRQVDQTCKNTQGIEANGVLEFTGVFPFVKVSGGGKRTSASEALTAVRELERPIVVQEEGAVSNKQEFTWSICLGREHERSALLANGEVKRRIVPPEQGPIVEDYCTNLTAVWLVKASEVEMQLEVEVERTLKYVRIMKDRPAFLKYLVKEKNVGLDVVQNGIAMIRWGFKAGSGDMQVNI
ncbi:disease resistance protein (TIR-NBS-LRR class) family [Klebsormidium nitens]|uniref:Disease resistance protein (TIR-NBS-LRR class) family n=1 Tax=Klebsormidium nitens TaxID=105231 RepID=A0A1Y1I5F8_KLENI|nr:disease resistance protein (TIR-NBS-LRR class) family [Klebsormidium nitens]|eukprot:GAQ83946.1 disease resistance protein (TIR-NBS-LRR class) family [Klebsormidium nitens]